jgi:hypothetical protein
MSNLSNVPEFRNQVLAKLSFEDLDLLPPHLQPVRLEPIREVYLPESGFASVVAKYGDRREPR